MTTNTTQPGGTNDVRGAILAKCVRSAVAREVKTLGGITVYIRRLSALESDEYQTGMVGRDGKIDFAKFPGYRARLVSMCLCTDESGNDRPFTKDEVNGWANDIVEELVTHCQEVNNLGKKAAEEAGNG